MADRRHSKHEKVVTFITYGSLIKSKNDQPNITNVIHIQNYFERNRRSSEKVQKKTEEEEEVEKATKKNSVASDT